MSRSRGQVLPLALVALLALLVLLLLALNLGVLASRRVETQTAADASAWTGGVCYARALNAAALTNDLLLGAGMADLLVFLIAPEAQLEAAAAAKTAPPVLYRLLAKAQDAFLSAWRVVSFEEPVRIGLANDVLAIQVWDDLPSRNVVPRFQLKRTYLLETAFPALRKKLKGNAGASGEAEAAGDAEAAKREREAAERAFRDFLKGKSGQGTKIGTEEEESYRYWDSDKKRWVDVSPDEVEKVTFRRRGRVVTQHRTRRRGGASGVFVERNTARRRSADIPLPLIEEDPLHVVLTCAIRRPERLPFAPAPLITTKRAAEQATSAVPPLLAFAETEVYGGSLGYWLSVPTWRARFCRVHIPDEASHLVEGDGREQIQGKESWLNERLRH